MKKFMLEIDFTKASGLDISEKEVDNLVVAITKTARDKGLLTYLMQSRWK